MSYDAGPYTPTRSRVNYFDRHLYLTSREHVNCRTLDLSNCFISSQFTHNRLNHVHLTGSKKAYII